MYPKSFFYGLFVVLKIAGLYYPVKESYKWRLFHYTSTVIIATVLCVLFQPAELAMISLTSKNLKTFIEHTGMFLTHLMGTIKFCTVLWNVKRLWKIMEILEDDDYKYEDYKHYKPGESMNQCKKYSDYIAMFLFWMATLVPVVKQYGSIAKFRNVGHLIGVGNMTCQDILPYYNWFPFFTDDYSSCIIAFILQSIPMIWYVYPIIGGDLVFMYACHALRGHFICLRGAFSTCYQRCLVRNDLPEDYELINIEEKPRLHQEVHREMRKMSLHLQTMIGIVAEIESIWYLVTLLQNLTSMFMIVSCLYMITNEPFMSTDFIAQIQFIAAGTTEIFLYCMIGNEIILSSSGIQQGIYGCQWYSFAKPDKLSMIINMARLQQPIALTTGKMAVLSLSTFVSIVRGSYSYYTFLTKTH